MSVDQRSCISSIVKLVNNHKNKIGIKDSVQIINIYKNVVNFLKKEKILHLVCVVLIS